MKKRAIKIVKPGAEVVAPRELTAEEIVVRRQKDVADGEREIAESVKSWITERVENSKAEDIRSESDRRAWDGNSRVKKRSRRR